MVAKGRLAGQGMSDATTRQLGNKERSAAETRREGDKKANADKRDGNDKKRNKFEQKKNQQDGL